MNIGFVKYIIPQTNFHGVRLHLFANRQIGRLPIPTKVWLKEGNVHDLTALGEIKDELPEVINLFGDKAYANKDFKDELHTWQIQLPTRG